MDYRSTLIRNVEIPSTLPSMETLTKLEGSIILKDVEQAENGVRIEGDLLWRGFFEEEGINGGECLWEGAEYFAETIDSDTLRSASPPLIEPQVVTIHGEPLSDSTFRLTFDVRWYGQPDSEEEYMETVAKENKSATCPCKQKAKQNMEETLAQVEATSPPEERKNPQPEKTDFDEKMENINETWRETMKTIQKETENNEIDEIQEIEEKSAPLPKRTEVIASDKVDQEEMLNDDAIKYCPYSVFCLRYYRIQDGDELEKIAERFSATVAKLKEYNALEDNHLKSGRLIRIP